MENKCDNKCDNDYFHDNNNYIDDYIKIFKYFIRLDKSLYLYSSNFLLYNIKKKILLSYNFNRFVTQK